MAWYKNKREKLKVERGEDVSRAYESWTSMRRRVRHADPKRKEKCYEGIKIASEWDNFEVFLKDVGTPLKNQSIDRINPSGNYEKNNCRWADSVTQARNRNYCKFNEKKAHKVKLLYEQGFSQQQIANKFNCSQVTISKIVRNVTWFNHNPAK